MEELNNRFNIKSQFCNINFITIIDYKKIQILRKNWGYH